MSTRRPIQNHTKPMVLGVDYKKIDPDKNHGRKYELLREQWYYSHRYEKFIHAAAGFQWDGATGARDLVGSRSHLFHDVLCNECAWHDGTPLSNWQCSQVLKDILKEEGHTFRQYTWRWATFLLGGWKVKALNGWFAARLRCKRSPLEYFPD